MWGAGRLPTGSPQLGWSHPTTLIPTSCPPGPSCCREEQWDPPDCECWARRGWQAWGAARAPLTPHCHPQCQHIVGICQSIVGCSPPALLDCRAVLQRVGLALAPSPQGSPPMSPSTPTLPLGLWQSPPTSPDTPMLPPSQWSSPPGSPDTTTPPSDLLGTPQLLLSARLVSPLHPSAPLCLGTPSPLLKPPSCLPPGL